MGLPRPLDLRPRHRRRHAATVVRAAASRAGIVRAGIVRAGGGSARPARAQRALLHLAIFAFSAMTLLAAARWYDRAHPLLRLELTQYQPGIPDLQDDLYLDYRGTPLAYNAFTYDWDDVIDAARKADVLFLGNSHTIYSFRPKYYQPWLDKIGLRGFNMGFFGGGGLMPLWVIRKYDLHPKMVVINDEMFLHLDPTPYGDLARREGAWNAFKDYFGATAMWLLRKHLHQLVPPLRDFTGRPPKMVIYRSRHDGAAVFAYGVSEGRPLTRLPGPEPSKTLKEWIDKNLPRARAFTGEFMQEMDRRGILVVRTALQDNRENAGYYLSRRLNAEERRIYVDAIRPDLIGQAGAHIDEQSSKRLMNDIMPKILALPQVQALARPPRGNAR